MALARATPQTASTGQTQLLSPELTVANIPIESDWTKKRYPLNSSTPQEQSKRCIVKDDDADDMPFAIRESRGSTFVDPSESNGFISYELREPTDEELQTVGNILERGTLEEFLDFVKDRRVSYYNGRVEIVYTKAVKAYNIFNGEQEDKMRVTNWHCPFLVDIKDARISIYLIREEIRRKSEIGF
jgi:hypothetical protein